MGKFKIVINKNHCLESFKQSMLSSTRKYQNLKFDRYQLQGFDWSFLHAFPIRNLEIDEFYYDLVYSVKLHLESLQIKRIFQSKFRSFIKIELEKLKRVEVKSWVESFRKALPDSLEEISVRYSRRERKADLIDFINQQRHLKILEIRDSRSQIEFDESKICQIKLNKLILISPGGVGNAY